VRTAVSVHWTSRSEHSVGIKAGIFALAGLNSIATTYYFYYVYFFTQERFGFGRVQNLILAAFLGFIYTFASIFCGRFAQKRGYFLSLRVGFSIMAAVLAAGSQIHSIAGHVAVMVLCDIGMCFTWPTLEAMASAGEPIRLQRMVGIYNTVWAAGGAFAYFTGGAMLEKLGLQSMFLVPAAMQLGQLALVFRLEKRSAEVASRLSTPQNPIASHAREPELSREENTRGAEGPVLASWERSRGGQNRGAGEPSGSPTETGESNPHSIAKARTFLRMAWLANPFAYLAINTIIAVIPSLAKQLNLTPMFAGVFCSIWLFVRVGAFGLLWGWSGWHYRFGWLISAYAAMVASFALILLVPNLPLLMAAQILFGLAVGLIYYSSLFYSMDVGKAQSEHSGFHEATIGAGSCAGPAIGAAALLYFPHAPASSAWAVSGMLLVGLTALIWLGLRR
jgi:MFS family permease